MYGFCRKNAEFFEKTMEIFIILDFNEKKTEHAYGRLSGI